MFPIYLGPSANELFLGPFQHKYYVADHKTKDKSNRLNVAQDKLSLYFVFFFRPVRSMNHQRMQAVISEINISHISNNIKRQVFLTNVHTAPCNV